MLHILLIILKILGILLLVLLGILLAVILAVLFVPVCYRAEGRKTEKEISAKATVSWLFHLLHGRVRYEGENIDFEIFLFGIPLLACKKRMDQRKEKRKKKSEENVRSTVKNIGTEPGAAKADHLPEETAPEQETAKPIQAADGTSETQKQQEGAPERKSRTGWQLWDKIKKGCRAILEFPSRCMEKLKKIRLTFRTFCDKIKQWRTFLKQDTTKLAVRYVLGRSRRLLRHILPGKIRGSITFGFEDPCTTGQVLALAGVLYPVHKNRLQMIPVFDRKILEGKIRLRGRIFGGYLLLLVWQVFWNKEVRVTYRRFQHKEA